MSKHTPEPWVQQKASGSIWAGNIEINNRTSLWGTNVVHVAECEEQDNSAKKHIANAARIVACVNACAGMADPAAEIAQLRADKSRLEWFVSEVYSCSQPGYLRDKAFQLITQMEDSK